jgi:hypothetical protein
MWMWCWRRLQGWWWRRWWSRGPRRWSWRRHWFLGGSLSRRLRSQGHPTGQHQEECASDCAATRSFHETRVAFPQTREAPCTLAPPSGAATTKLMLNLSLRRDMHTDSKGKQQKLSRTDRGTGRGDRRCFPFFSFLLMLPTPNAPCLARLHASISKSGKEIMRTSSCHHPALVLPHPPAIAPASNSSSAQRHAAQAC